MGKTIKEIRYIKYLRSRGFHVAGEMAKLCLSIQLHIYIIAIYT